MPWTYPAPKGMNVVQTCSPWARVAPTGRVKATADRCGRPAQTKGEGGNDDRAMLGDRLPDPVPGPRTKTLRLGIGPVHSVGTLGTLGSTMVID